MADDGQARVWVIDTSSILQIRRMYDPAMPSSQHRIVADADYVRAIYDHLSDLVAAGRLTFPSQVVAELYPASSPDLAGAWIHSQRLLRKFGDPDYSTLIAVQQEITLQFGHDNPLADTEKSIEDADPWIVAQAMELFRDGLLAAVVTEDRRDRGTTSVTTACNHLDLPCVQTRPFLNHCGAPPEPEI